MIEHDAGAAEWTPAERSARADDRHPVGGRVRLAGLEVRTPSPATAAGRIRSNLAVAVEPAGRSAVRIRLAGHEVRLSATEDGPAALIDLVADIPLRTRIAQLRDCRIRLRGLPGDGAASPHPDADPDV